MDPLIVLRRMVVAAVLAAAAAGCAEPPAQWRRLQPEEWAWHHRGDAWVRGVATPELTFRISYRDGTLRLTALGLGDGPGSVEVTGPVQAQTWRVGAGEQRSLSVRLRAAGAYTVRTRGDIAVGEPRVGRSGQRRLVVFILVDTLRADHATLERMPGVSGFFSTGRRWWQATANAPWTLPSMASIFTSRPVLDLTTPEGDLVGVPEGVASWPEVMDRGGFIGGAVVANYTVGVLNGFGRGFSSYVVPDGHGSSNHPDAAWVVAEARRWLAAHQGENGFLYLHFMDPHEPYRDHEGLGRSGPPLAPLAHRKRAASAEEAGRLRDLYASEVRHVDQVLTPFLAELPPKATAVFTADHGESLGEHGCWGHGLTLYQEAIAVPLMVRGRGVKQGGSSAPVALVGIAPTLLDLAGLAADRSMTGSSLLKGTAPPVVSATFGAGPLRWSWREGADKVVLRLAPQPGLSAEARSTMGEDSPLPTGVFHFRLEEDPGELHPLSLGEELAPRVGRAFASTTGRMVPGLQLLAWGLRGEATFQAEIGGELSPVQTLSTAPVELFQEGGVVTVSCREAFPVCAVAGPVSPQPRRIRLLAGAHPWLGVPDGGEMAVADLGRPRSLPGSGLVASWNPPRKRIVGGYRETIRKLRDLGYLQ